MTANVQISKKLDDGTILVVGGETYDEFMTLANDMTNGAGDELGALFFNLIPAAAGPAQAAYEAATMQQAHDNVIQAFPDATPPPAGEVLCPTHKQPLKRVDKKAGGFFYKCQVNNTGVTEFGQPGEVLKKYCPKPKD